MELYYIFLFRINYLVSLFVQNQTALPVSVFCPCQYLPRFFSVSIEAFKMSAGPLIVDIIVAFILAAGLLYRYGNWQRHHFLVTLAVLISWYFSLLIVFVLPLDVSSVS